MIVTVEISLYPLQEDYKNAIITFLNKMRGHKDIVCRTTEMSTLIKGEWSEVMSILEKELGVVFNAVGNSSTVLKIIPKDLPFEEGYVKW